MDTTSQSAFLVRLLLRPWVIPRELLAPTQLWTAALFIGVSAPLAVPRPKFLLLLVPGLALALLAEHGAQTELDLHYSANVLAVAFLVALPAVGVWSALPGSALARAAPAGSSAYRIISALRPPAVTAIAVAGFLGMSPFSPFADANRAPTAEHRAAVLAALALIPGDDQVRVSAQSGILPRLSQRDNIHEFPARALDAEWVIVDRYGHRSSQSVADGYDGRLDTVRRLDERVFDRDGVEVFRRRQ